MEGVLLEKRLGFIGITVSNREENASRVNELISRYGSMIVARTGFPHTRLGCAVISLVVEATTDEIGRLTGELGSIPMYQ
jgi:putative iron-only hydrogenase system regulator